MIAYNILVNINKNFDHKEEAKKHLYDLIDPMDFKFKQMTKLLQEKYGEDHFFMTFIHPNVIVLNHKMEQEDYYDLQPHLKDILTFLINKGNEVKISQCIELK